MAGEKIKTMGLTPAGLRTWIAVIAGLLVAAIAGFFVYGRWQGRRLGHDVPDGLGTSVQQSTEGFTHSESRGGHTIYSLHASKAVQFKNDGHLELHDVSITLYGAQGAPSNRIYGSDFDWDPVNGIARAMGEVQIDFQGSAAPAPKPARRQRTKAKSKNTVHVKTSDLVFNKKTGLASTTERIEFRLAQAAGSATGASFDSQTGIIILDADVAFNSSVGGNPLAVRAHHAQYDRASRLLYLLQDVTDYADSHSSSDQATVSFRTDGSAYQVEAQGNVVLTGSDGQQINTRQGAHRPRPQERTAAGGLGWRPALRGQQCRAPVAWVGLLGDALVRSAIHRQARAVARRCFRGGRGEAAAGSERIEQVQAESARVDHPPGGSHQVDIDFTSGPDRRPMAEHILAVGGARLNVHTIYAKTPPEDTTVTGDQLFATLLDGEVLSSLRGTGHTGLVDVSPNGVKQTSTGDNLLLTFAPPHPSRQAGGESGQRKTRTTDSAAGRSVAVRGASGKRDPDPGNAGEASRWQRPAWRESACCDHRRRPASGL